jgi:hypothetical protein
LVVLEHASPARRAVKRHASVILFAFHRASLFMCRWSSDD